MRDLSREAFLSHVWEWKSRHGNSINSQLRRLGASLDWSAEYFTLDAMRSRLVTEAFCSLHEGGLVYRATRLVHWCCHLQSVLSDIEVDYSDVEGQTWLNVNGRSVQVGVLHYIAYPLEFPLENDITEMIIATTRPETLPGDVALAVHSKDLRYSHLIGKTVVHPLTGKTLPIVADEHVDPNYGTGILKITPAHDFIDNEIGQRHQLQAINLFLDNGMMNDACPQEYRGLDRFDARSKIVAALKESQHYRGMKDHRMRIARCSRTGDLVEPMLRPQWFIRCSDPSLSKKADEAIMTGKIRLVPETFVGEWKRWMVSLRDWCVSRQLWWGHRIPAYRLEMNHVTDGKDTWIVARSLDEANIKAQEIMKRNQLKGDLLPSYRLVQVRKFYLPSSI